MLSNYRLGEKQADMFADSILKTIVEKDIFQRLNITNKHDFNKILDFIFDSVGSYVSPRSISDTLRSNGTVIDKQTVFNYPELALRELLMNACMHRDYQSNMPIRLYQYDDRIEILNAGGLYGEARPENFPTVNDYRNPIIAEAMRGLKYVNMFNRGIERVKTMFKENGNPEPTFKVDKITAFEVLLRPTLSLNLVTDKEKVTKSVTKITEKVNDIIAFCSVPRSMTEIMDHIGMKHRYNVKHRYIDPLVESGFFEMTIPDKPNSRSQKYKRTLT